MANLKDLANKLMNHQLDDSVPGRIADSLPQEYVDAVARVMNRHYPGEVIKLEELEQEFEKSGLNGKYEGAK